MLKNILENPNGTRLAVKKVLAHVVDATLLTGIHLNEDVLVLWKLIILTDLFSELNRFEFPVLK